MFCRPQQEQPLPPGSLTNDVYVNSIETLQQLSKVKSGNLQGDGIVTYGLHGAEIRGHPNSLNNNRSIRHLEYIHRVYMKHGAYRIGWIIDDQIHNCMICDLTFSIVERRHHCRACGNVICNGCSLQRAAIKQLSTSENGNGILDKEHRVCDICASKHFLNELWDLNISDDSREPTEAKSNIAHHQDLKTQGNSAGLQPVASVLNECAQQCAFAQASSTFRSEENHSQGVTSDINISHTTTEVKNSTVVNTFNPNDHISQAIPTFQTSLESPELVEYDKSFTSPDSSSNNTKENNEEEFVENKAERDKSFSEKNTDGISQSVEGKAKSAISTPEVKRRSSWLGFVSKSLSDADSCPEKPTTPIRQESTVSSQSSAITVARRQSWFGFLSTESGDSYINKSNKEASAQEIDDEKYKGESSSDEEVDNRRSSASGESVNTDRSSVLDGMRLTSNDSLIRRSDSQSLSSRSVSIRGMNQQQDNMSATAPTVLGDVPIIEGERPSPLSKFHPTTVLVFPSDSQLSQSSINVAVRRKQSWKSYLGLDTPQKAYGENENEF